MNKRNINAVDLLILGLATWRLSSLLGNVDEHGPYDLLTRFRALCGVVFDEHSDPQPDQDAPRWKQELVKGILCHWCNSIWIGSAIAAAYALLPSITVMLCLPLALSCVTIMLQRGIIDTLRRMG